MGITSQPLYHVYISDYNLVLHLGLHRLIASLRLESLKEENATLNCKLYGFSDGSVVKNSPANAGDAGLTS